MVRTKTPEALTAVYNPILFMGVSSFAVQTVPGAMITLTNAGTVYGKGVADVSGSAVINLTTIPIEPMDLTLTIFAFNKQTYIQTLQVLPSDGPYVVVDSANFTDDNDGIFQYGESIMLNLDLANIGSEVASAVSVAISSLDSYINIPIHVHNIGDIANGGNATTGGFPLEIATDVPDQHMITLNIAISTVDGDTYDYTCSFTANAPDISWGALQVDDSEGNNNGRVDAGENVSLTFNVSNTGHCQADDVNTTIVVNGVSHLITPILSGLTALPVGGQAQIIYNVTFSSQIPMGTPVQITAMSMFGDYISMNTYTVVVGMVLENFESGLVNFPWNFTGGTWTLAAGSYNGSTAAKSATISNSGSTSMSITMDVTQAGEISFWKKVSSEQNYDFLKFYINGTLKDQWSGIIDGWSQATYPVQAGTNMFRWEYMKDSGTASGSDCAWIDDISFPSSGGQEIGVPILVIDQNALDYQTVQVNSHAMIPIILANRGTASMIGTLTTEAPFSLGLDPTNPTFVLEYNLSAGDSLVINVNFSPTAYMPYAGELIITSDDPLASLIIIPLSGAGDNVANEDQINPVITELRGNYPNPFNPTTTISFSLKNKSAVKLDIYNLLGQKVRTLVNGEMAAGVQNVTWNGRDGNNRPVASGVYFYKMQSGKYTSTKKMIMMK
jgi:hypothetical protein